MSGCVRTLFVARHGETDWNADGRWQGQTDVPLNDRGRVQARALAHHLRSERVVAVVSSDLARARSTAEIVIQVLGLARVHLDPDLREQGFGAFEGLTRRECEARFPEAWARYLADSRSTPPGGESHADLVARIGAAVLRISETLPEPTLIVMHGGAMRALVSEQLGSIPNPASAAWSAKGIPNGGIFRLSVKSGGLVAATRLG
jgi:broad specificity phosphatase PhoE